MRFYQALLAVTVAVSIALGLAASPYTAHPAVAASTLQLSRYKAAAGDSVTAKGFGFAAGDDVVFAATLSVNGKAQRVSNTAPADSGGTASATLTVPGGTNQGTYTVTGKDFHGHSASTRLTVLPLAYLAVGGKTNTTYVIPMHEFYISGAGFQAGESISLSATFPQYNGNSVVVSRSVQTDNKGSFSEVDVRVPRDAKAGTVNLKATGQSSNKTASGFLRVFYRPYLTLDSSTVRPGTDIGIHGREFVPDSTVAVSLTIPRVGDTTLTLSRNVTANVAGSFDTAIGLPANVALGRYTLSAVDAVGHYRAAIAVTVSVHPTIALSPTAVLPGQSVDVSGENFGNGVQVTVSATFPLQGGGNKTVSVTTTTGGRGNYAARLGVPADASAGQVTVTAHASNGQVSAKLQVQQPPSPTATPTGTAAPAATATNVPAQHQGFGFRYVSIWYHVVRAGTWDYLGVQSSLTVKLGIWVHVWFPSGLGSLAWFQNTNSHGFWHMRFAVPANAFSPNNSHVLVTIRLWHGGQSRRSFTGFTLIR